MASAMLQTRSKYALMNDFWLIVIYPVFVKTYLRILKIFFSSILEESNEAEVITEKIIAEDHKSKNHTPKITHRRSNTEKYKVLENWAKKGDFPNQPTPHPCDRVCKKDESMICRYTFVLELHTSMGKVNV